MKFRVLSNLSWLNKIIILITNEAFRDEKYNTELFNSLTQFSFSLGYDVLL